MIYLILIVIGVFIFMFCAMMWKIVISKDKLTKKRRLDFTSAKKAFLTKFLWALFGTFVVVYVISLLVPIFIMILNSFKSLSDYHGNKYGIPSKFHFENYWNVLLDFKVNKPKGGYFGLLDMFVNSVIYSCGNPLVSVFWIYVVAYAMSRFTWFGNKFLYGLGIILMTVTLTGSSASQMLIYKRIGLYDNLYLSTILPPSTAFSGMYFMIVHGACKSISLSYSEAAYIDGAGEYRVMFKIIFPMIIPTLCTLYVLTFLSLWNQYETFFVWFPSYPNLAYGLYYLRMLGENGSAGLNKTEAFTATVILMIPSIILYLSTQKILRSNFIVGGLKG